MPVITLNGTQLSTAAVGQLQWNLDGNALPGETGATLETTTYGDGFYTLTIMDNNGCSATSDPLAIGVGAALSESPNVISGIYPNPATSSVTLEMYNAVPQQVILTTVLGQEIDRKLVTGSIKWNIDQLDSGVYYFRSVNGSQTRFIKQ